MPRRFHAAVALSAAFVLCFCPAGDASAQAPGRKLALIVGVDAYRSSSGLPPLSYSTRDASALGGALRPNGFTIFEMTHDAARQPGNETLAPNADYIRDQLNAILSYPNLGADDAIIVSLHGHGVQFDEVDAGGRKTPRFYFCPADATIDGVATANDLTDRNHLMPLDELYQQLGRCKAATKLLVVDACRNDPTRPAILRSGLASATLPKLPPPPGGTAAFFSCKPNERAVEDPKLQQGVFTHFLVEGLSGKADLPLASRPADGVVTLAELSAYVANNTYAHVYQTYRVKQSPELRGDFDLNLPLTGQYYSESDPTALLRASAQATKSPASVSVRIAIRAELKQDDKEEVSTAWFTYRTASKGRFELVSRTEDDQFFDTGYYVASNGIATVTALLSRKKHMITEGKNGLNEFIASPSATTIGAGLGGLALAFLDPAAMEELIDVVEKSELVGIERLNGHRVMHVRFTVSSEIGVDAWIAADGPPLLVRLVPNLLGHPEVINRATKDKSFEYKLVFDFMSWNTSAHLSEQDIRVVEPEGSQFTKSLYLPEEAELHPLLGKAMPTTVLANLAGAEVDIASLVGESVVVFEFWSTHCPPCRLSLPATEEVCRRYAGRGVKHYAINIDEVQGGHDDSIAKRVAEAAKDMEIQSQILLDPGLKLTDLCELDSYPLVLTVDRSRKVQAVIVGCNAATEHQAKLSEHIEGVLAGRDLAAAEVAIRLREEQSQEAERQRLVSLLDD